MKIEAKILLSVVLLLFVSSCDNDTVYTPKPRIYPKVIYPDKELQDFISDRCPFKFQIPNYFKIIKDSTNTVFNDSNECWFDLYCEPLNSYIHLSYLSFNGRSEYDELVADAFELVDKHNIKASYRDEFMVKTKMQNVSGVVFKLDGPVASPFQFFLTDSTSHFLRGSLYFKAAVNRDSIAPVYEYLQSDLNNLIYSLEWIN